MLYVLFLITVYALCVIFSVSIHCILCLAEAFGSSFIVSTLINIVLNTQNCVRFTLVLLFLFNK